MCTARTLMVGLLLVFVLPPAAASNHDECSVSSVSYDASDDRDTPTMITSDERCDGHVHRTYYSENDLEDYWGVPVTPGPLDTHVYIEYDLCDVADGETYGIYAEVRWVNVNPLHMLGLAEPVGQHGQQIFLDDGQCLSGGRYDFDISPTQNDPLTVQGYFRLRIHAGACFENSCPYQPYWFDVKAGSWS